MLPVVDPIAQLLFPSLRKPVSSTDPTMPFGQPTTGQNWFNPQLARTMEKANLEATENKARLAQIHAANLAATQAAQAAEEKRFGEMYDKTPELQNQFKNATRFNAVTGGMEEIPGSGRQAFVNLNASKVSPTTLSSEQVARLGFGLGTPEETAKSNLLNPTWTNRGLIAGLNLGQPEATAKLNAAQTGIAQSTADATRAYNLPWMQAKTQYGNLFNQDWVNQNLTPRQNDLMLAQTQADLARQPMANWLQSQADVLQGMRTGGDIGAYPLDYANRIVTGQNALTGELFKQDIAPIQMNALRNKALIESGLSPWTDPTGMTSGYLTKEGTIEVKPGPFSMMNTGAPPIGKTKTGAFKMTPTAGTYIPGGGARQPIVTPGMGYSMQGMPGITGGAVATGGWAPPPSMGWAPPPAGASAAVLPPVNNQTPGMGFDPRFATGGAAATPEPVPAAVPRPARQPFVRPVAPTQANTGDPIIDAQIRAQEEAQQDAKNAAQMAILEKALQEGGRLNDQEKTIAMNRLAKAQYELRNLIGIAHSPATSRQVVYDPVVYARQISNLRNEINLLQSKIGRTY